MKKLLVLTLIKRLFTTAALYSDINIDMGLWRTFLLLCVVCIKRLVLLLDRLHYKEYGQDMYLQSLCKQVFFCLVGSRCP